MRPLRWVGVGLLTLFPGIACQVGNAGADVGDAQRELIVQFVPNALHFPNDPEAVRAPALAGMPTDLGTLLGSLGVDRVRRALPNAYRALTIGPRHSTTLLPPLNVSDLFVLRADTAERCGELVELLRQRNDVVYAERNGSVVAMGTPNDVSFHRQWGAQNGGQYSGGVGSDIRAWSAWDLHKGSTSEMIGIIGEEGKISGHTEFGSRLLGNLGTALHATQVAGIAAAKGDNFEGIAGVDWNCWIHVSDGADDSYAGMADDIYASMNTGARVLNNSWHQGSSGGIPDPWNNTVATAIAYAYNNGATIVFGMPESDHTNVYPSNYFSGDLSINVGACTNTNLATTYQLANPWVDVAAPGGTADQLEKGLYTTEPGNSYGYVVGTSYAVPYVAGASSLLRSYGGQLLGYNLASEDVEELLKRSADDIDLGYFDNKTGFGRINVRRALDFVGAPNGLKHESVVGGTAVSSWPNHEVMSFFGGVLGNYAQVKARQYTVERVVTPTWIGQGSTSTFWTRGSASVGWHGASPQNYSVNYSKIVSGGGPSWTLRTFVYHVTTMSGAEIGNGWWPSTVANTVFAWTTFRYTPTPYSLQLLSLTNSYFVPQTGTIGSPNEGTLAISLFRACPNNDSGSLPSNARIKIVLRDTANQPMRGVSPADIYTLLRGGTAAQGFPAGGGADSVIANSIWNRAPLCPDVRSLAADAPTDTTGMTYITFIGADPSFPGVAVRNPVRKWGHYDSEFPVYALGAKLQGRLTSTSANGTYILQIKNLDLEMGLGAAMNLGEMVTSSDYASVNAHVNEPDSADPKNWWRDFNSSGLVDSSDFGLVVNHQNHNCTTPNNP